MPRGMEPVLFSRSLNSWVLTAASTVIGSIPSRARPLERVENERLDLHFVGGVHALEADGEHGLAQ